MTRSGASGSLSEVSPIATRKHTNAKQQAKARPSVRGARKADPAIPKARKVHVLTLGCPKNQADSEGLLMRAMGMGYERAEDASDADIVIVNTCGFIEQAKRESIDEILTLSSVKREGQELVVMGCLAKRYESELKRELPEVDRFFGLAEDKALAGYLGAGSVASKAARWQSLGDVSHVAPLKVAEGCNRGCSFCVIPSIRGPFRSRKPDEILREAEQRVAQGARELMLVAQDLSRYGAGLRGYGLPELLRDLSLIKGDFWIRPMYLYPTEIDSALMEAIATTPKVTKYIDVPLQHASDKVLRAMARKGTRAGYRRLIERLRREIEGVFIRTSMIVGLPGEGESDFKALIAFIREMRFDHLGAFLYSREEGSRAALMRPQVNARVAMRRYDELMGAQAGISYELNKSMVGRRMRALIDEASSDATIGRHEGQAYEIDGAIVIKGKRPLRAGDFVEVEITGAGEYDLEARAL